MAIKAPFKPNTLVQFYLKRVVTDPVITVISANAESFEATLGRKFSRAGWPDPVEHLKRDRAKASDLPSLIKGASLDWVDIESEIRTGKGGETYFLLTFKFGEKVAPRARHKALSTDGAKLFDTFLAKAWKHTRFSTFPNEPETCSLLFSGEMEATEIAEAVSDAEAAK